MSEPDGQPRPLPAPPPVPPAWPPTPPPPSPPTWPPAPPGPPAPQGVGHRGAVVAAVITAAATIAAALIAPAVISQGNRGPDAPPPAGARAVDSASPGAGGAPGASSGPLADKPTSSVTDRPVDRLPSAAADSATPHAGPRVIVSPDMAAEGTVVQLTVSGFAPGDQIRISFSDTRGAVEDDMRDVVAGPDGGFVAEVKVPADRGKGYEKPRFRVWSVSDVDSENTADTPFTYLD